MGEAHDFLTYISKLNMVMLDGFTYVELGETNVLERLVWVIGDLEPWYPSFSKALPHWQTSHWEIQEAGVKAICLIIWSFAMHIMWKERNRRVCSQE